MGLDIRIPIGSLFVILGALLAGYGLVSSPAIYQRSLGINVNLWWGAALLVFGFAMLALAWRAASSRAGSRNPGAGGTQGRGVRDAAGR
jgi:multisubunit Na+/H+ antiporter MnhG subunit